MTAILPAIFFGHGNAGIVAPFGVSRLLGSVKERGNELN